MLVDAIVSVTSDWAIGNEGGLVVSNRDDMRRFVSLTKGCTVLMGRKTFESFPGGPLKGRRNVVVTRQPSYELEHPGIECAHSLDAALDLIASDENDRGVWLIGGERLYRSLLSRCKRCYVTRNHTSVDADAYFPNLDEDEDWLLERVEEGGVTAEDVPFDYAIYKNLAMGF